MANMMVERVAAQMCEKIGRLALEFSNAEIRFLARAAIEGMREPTDSMAEAGHEHTGDPCWQEDVKEAWRAMIDEALKDA